MQYKPPRRKVRTNSFHYPVKIFPKPTNYISGLFQALDLQLLNSSAFNVHKKTLEGKCNGDTCFTVSTPSAFANATHGFYCYTAGSIHPCRGDASPPSFPVLGPINPSKVSGGAL